VECAPGIEASSMDFDTIKVYRDAGVVFAALAAPPMNLLGPSTFAIWSL